MRILAADLGGEPACFRASRKAGPALVPLPGAALDKPAAKGALARIDARWTAKP